MSRNHLRDFTERGAAEEFVASLNAVRDKLTEQPSPAM
jgi:hypothetical protein